jgi:hypothetical protein
MFFLLTSVVTIISAYAISVYALATFTAPNLPNVVIPQHAPVELPISDVFIAVTTVTEIDASVLTGSLDRTEAREALDAVIAAGSPELLIVLIALDVFSIEEVLRASETLADSITAGTPNLPDILDILNELNTLDFFNVRPTRADVDYIISEISEARQLNDRDASGVTLKGEPNVEFDKYSNG